MELRIVAAVVAVLAFAGCKDDRELRADAAAPADAAPTDAPAVCAGGTIGYLQLCTQNTECGTTCECHDFGHSQVCTKTCTMNSDCPAPSPGCSSTGYCRK